MLRRTSSRALEIVALDIVALVAVVAVVASNAACFDASLPKGALLLCHDDAECPVGTCDKAAHVCATTAGARTTGPVAAKATFTPAFAKDGDHVLLEIATDEPVAASPAPVLTFAGADTANPGFVLEAPDGGAHAVFTLDVSASIPERFFTLTAVELADAEQRVTVSPVDAALDIDRTPPVLAGVVVDDGAGGTAFADVAPHDAVRVRFASSEPLDETALAVTVGALALHCDAGDGSGAYACTGALDGATDGTNPVAINAVDRAGNAATFATSIAVDASAPFIVPGSVVVRVNQRTDFVAVSTGDVVDIDFLASEALSAAPALTLGGAGSSALPFQVTQQQQSNFYTAHLVVGLVAVDGVQPVLASLTDVFGHASTAVVVPLPPPHDQGLDVVAVPPSPCIVPAESAGGSTCTDFDGDGFFGPSAGCAPDPVDCDDADPTVYPGAFEVPGNGKDDGCTGLGDAPFDEAHVVFDDPNSTDPAADGTRAHPFAAFEPADALAAQTGRVVVAAQGEFGRNSTVTLFAPFLGGYDAATWTRTPGATRTHFTLSNGSVSVQGGYVSGADFNQQINNSGITELVDIGTTHGVSVAFPVTIVDSDVFGSTTGDLFLFGNADGSRVLRSRIGASFPSSANLTFDRDVFFGVLGLGDNSAASITNSVLFGDSNVVVGCTNCASLVIAFSNLRGAGAGGAVVDIEAGAEANVVLASDNIVTQSDVPAIFKQPGSKITIDDSVIQEGGTIVQVNGVANDVVDPAVFAACGWDGCVDAAGDQFAPLALAQDQIHLAGDVANNPSFGAGSTFPRFLALPTTVAGDVDGQCRYVDGNPPDVGPDQR